MKNYFQFLLIFFCFAIFSRLNAQTFEWSKSSVGNSTDEGWSVATDTRGSIAVTGFYYSPFFNFGSNTIINVGGSDIFLSRFDTNGNVLWTKTAGGNNNDAAYSVATDKIGNIYIAGWFQSPTISFGSIYLNTNGAQDIFLTKYDTLGNVVWAQAIGGTSTDIGYGVATDTAGNVFITGEFYSPSISFGSITLTNSGSNGVFIAKCDSAGNFLWAKKAVASTGSCRSESITTDNSGNVFITGYYNSNLLAFGSSIIYNSNSGADNIFLVKYDNAGNVLWAKSSQGAGSNYSNDVATDFSGNSYITGGFSYSATVSFGNFTLNNINTGTSDVFVVKYDVAGNEKWASSGSGNGDDLGYSLVTDTNANIYISGGYDRNANQFSTLNFGSNSLPFPAGGRDPLFVAKYDSLGHIQCAFSLASGGDDVCAIAMDKMENIFLTGDFFISPFVVGSDTLFLSNPSNTSNENAFLTKFTMKCGADLIAETNFQTDLTIYPNPSNGIFTINFENTTYPKEEIYVYNILGNLIFQSKIENLKSKIDLTGNVNGIYFYRITNDNGITYSGKLILAK